MVSVNAVLPLASLSVPLLPRQIAALALEIKKQSYSGLTRAGKVFCNGALLHAVAQSKLFEDSKIFVDMSLRDDPETVLAAFEKLDNPENPDVMRDFIGQYFLPVGDVLEAWTPPDFKQMPPRLEAIPDAAHRAFALSLNSLWSTLGRKQDPAVALAPERHSALVRRHGMVVPGGRFQETYYWDSYWIVLGLLVCDMKDTARGVVENLLDDVRNFGFVPNGGRIYYLDRSQPPLLTEMVLAVYEATQDMDWLASVLPVLEHEYHFWMKPDGGHLVTIPKEFANHPDVDKDMVLNIFHSTSAEPRPESYIEDVLTATAAAKNLGRKPQEVCRALRAAAESGWDFSSRWLAAGIGGSADLETIDTTKVVPVDLNCILYRMELGLAKIHKEVNACSPESATTIQYYSDAAARRAKAIHSLLWVESQGSYRDLRLDTGTPSEVVSLSDYAAPSWAGLSCISPSIARTMLSSLKNSGLIQAGGASVTTLSTGQQWDAPNAWAPIEHMLIEGLDKWESDAEAKELADTLASAWLKSNLEAWQKTGVMYEKYDASKPGLTGDGGEYEPQIGFGWTNGVALLLLERQYQGSKMMRPTMPCDGDMSEQLLGM